MSRALLSATALVLLTASFVACSSGDEATGPEPGTCDAALAARRFEGGSPDGHRDPVGARAASQARAGRITDASWIRQPKNARQRARVGDFLLTNDKIAAYIEAEGPSDGYDTFGGEILALDRVGEDGRALGRSQYGETLLNFARQTLAPEHVTVLADGSDGGPAIVRASGTLKNIPFMDTFSAFLKQEYGFPAAIDYVLAPGSEELLLRMSLQNTRGELVNFDINQLYGFFQGSRSQLFTPGEAYGEARGETPFVAYVGDDWGFSFRALSSKLEAALGVSGFAAWKGRGFMLEPCGERSVDYAALAPSTGGLDGLLTTVRRIQGDASFREVTGVVAEAAGAPVAGAVVHATKADKSYVTRAVTDEKGRFSLHLPAEEITLTPTVAGRVLGRGATASASASKVDVAVPAAATIEVVATDKSSGALLPVRVQVIPEDVAEEAPASWGVLAEVNDRLFQRHATKGTASLRVPVGTHRVVVSRGYEYELVDQRVTVAAGETRRVDAVLEHSVDSAGVMCADFHIHSSYSADSPDTAEGKVASAVVDGLEIPVSSEHEWVGDFSPVVEALGLTSWAFGMASEELTTFAWGHFGVVPMTPRPDAVNNGAIDWVGRTPPEFFREVLALPEKPALIINHPRLGDSFQAYFSAASFDPKTAKGDAALWSSEFSAVEVFNNSDLEQNRKGSFTDWLALLDAGQTVWAVGSSDSHTIRTNPVGYPRTCLAFGHDDPKRLTSERVRDALKAGRATISGGLTMSVRGPDGKGPGETSKAGAFTVVVEAPSWLDAESLETIVDGDSVATGALTPVVAPGGRSAKRYEATVDVAARSSRERHYVVFHAKGPKGRDLAPLHPGRRPFAVSNPVFF